jgi:hypothetical protein
MYQNRRRSVSFSSKFAFWDFAHRLCRKVESWRLLRALLVRSRHSAMRQDSDLRCLCGLLDYLLELCKRVVSYQMSSSRWSWRSLPQTWWWGPKLPDILSYWRVYRHEIMHCRKCLYLRCSIMAYGWALSRGESNITRSYCDVLQWLCAPTGAYDWLMGLGLQLWLITLDNHLSLVQASHFDYTLCDIEKLTDMCSRMRI